MAPTYYQIDLSGRTLVGLIVVLALLLILAFALGYGAAWSTLKPADALPVALAAVQATPTPVPEVVVAPPDLPAPSPSLPAPPASPTFVPTPTATALAPLATPTEPRPTPTTARRPSPAAPTGELWVQVVAVSRPDAIENPRRELAKLGFGADRVRIVETSVAGGNVLYKVRVGPFPDRESADRVVARMRASIFKDAFVVTS